MPLVVSCNCNLALEKFLVSLGPPKMYVKVEGFAASPRLESNNGRVSKATFRKAQSVDVLRFGLDAAWGVEEP